MSHQQAAPSLEGEAQEGAAKPSAAAAPLTWVNLVSFAAYAVNLIIIYVSITGVFGATNTELSNKYQTLVTPAGFAFSIWGPIFIWEGIFAVTQMLPQFRGNPVVLTIAPFWWVVCSCQVAWSLAFAQEWITGALVLMLALLAGLLGLLWRANNVKCESALEFWLLRAPFSLHTGWIIVASALSVNVQADSARAAPEVLLALAVVSLAVIFAVASLFALALPRPDAIIPLVAAWALFAVNSELREATLLLDPSKHNFVPWDPMVLDAVETAAGALSLACFGLAVAGAALRIYGSGIFATCACTRGSKEENSESVVPQETTPGV